ISSERPYFLGEGDHWRCRRTHALIGCGNWMLAPRPGTTKRGAVPCRRDDLARLANSSAFIKTHDGRLGERIEIELKANDCGRRVGLHRQTVDADGVYREEIAVRVIARRWAGAAVTGRAEIGARL